MVICEDAVKQLEEAGAKAVIELLGKLSTCGAGLGMKSRTQHRHHILVMR